ncbi:MAG: InlB B-repeat-containing protein [Treponema sp.]|jgi:uncharacterized repeat protein (TIGR02543 family)|nr:InlB B-repeat-containing protein [Treponema sp.]
MKSDMHKKRLGTARSAALPAALPAALCAALLLFAGCKDLFHAEELDEDDDYYTSTYRVAFFSNSYSHWDERDVSGGGSVGSNMPAEPTRSGYAFDGWYTSSGGGGTQFTASTVVTRDISVYAKWTAAPAAPVVYELTQKLNWDNYVVTPGDFLPDGFAVHTGDMIEISFLMKTDTDITDFSVGIADWGNGGDWVAADWDATKSVAADGRFHRLIWTLTAQDSGPAGSAPLMIQFSIATASNPTVTVYVGDVSVTNRYRSSKH